LRQENEKLTQKIQNKMEDNLFLLTQLDRIKEDLASENSRTEHLQNLNFELSDQIKQLDEINFCLKEKLSFLSKARRILNLKD
jgi:hypothetical protein